ncbi:MAG: hypothetical protein ACTTJ3_06720 [Treponema sp.]
MKIKRFKGFLSLLFSLSLVLSACNTGGVDNNITPTPSVEKLKITFDATQIKCKKGYGGTGEEVASGVKVKEGEDYQFKAKLKEGEKLKHWVINDRARTYEKGETFSYTVRKNSVAEDANTITISFEKQ